MKFSGIRIVDQLFLDSDAEDFELKRVVSTFKLLRSSGYTLRIVPGTPEENAPVFDPELEQILRPAA